MDEPPTSKTVSVENGQPSADGEKPQRQDSDTNALPEVNVVSQGNGQKDDQYVTGFKFLIVMVSLTLVFFLVMLDLSIITTVSKPLACDLSCYWVRLTFSVGYTTYHK